jgi:Carboxypeptidase regulatory-like domain
MKRSFLGTMAAALACVGMIIPSSAYAVQPTVGATDVALRPGGLLVGQVVDRQGVPQANATVSIQYGPHEVVRTTTDQNGTFAAQGLRGGQYQLVTHEGASACRLWAANTAPPAARPAALVVSGNRVVRGQWGTGPLHGSIEWMKAHPYITAGAVAAAIAIPLALADDDDSSGS